MARVTINPVQTISVRVNQGVQATVSGTTQFIGASQSQSQANAALALAQAAYDTANTKVSRTGDTMTGNLIIQTPAELIAHIDGGTFS